MHRKYFEEIEEYQSPAWHQKMEVSGKAMKDSHVRQTIFVHGTFVGGDPFGLLGSLPRFGISSMVGAFLEEQGKTFTDFVVGDLGNFTEEYITAYSEAIGNNIECRKFDWSSANNHIGRLLAVPNLAENLAEGIDSISAPSENDRILLIGHSHAGQLFALLTVFLENSEKAQKLLDILQGTNGFDKLRFAEHLEKIATVYLDIITLGTPVRYRWGNYNKYQLLNIVNDRSDSTLGGVLNTRDGDYVQQWGTDGRDLIPTPLLIEKNNQLDELLDKGVSGLSSTWTFIRQLFTSQAESKRRQAFKENGDKAGDRLFIDYRDNGKNPAETLFGHGAYTKEESMLFNTSCIVKSLYSST